MPPPSDPDTHAQHKGNDRTEPAGNDPVLAGLREELALAQKKLQVVGSITRHDIMNQMTAIMGYNEILLTMVQDEKARHFLEIERRSADKIRRILAYSKVFQNIGTEAPRWQDLKAVTHLACEEINLGGVQVNVQIRSCSVYADPQIVNVLIYLFDNAVRHGKRTTTIRLLVEHNRNGPVLLVIDDGVGIAVNDKEKIFTRGVGKHTGWGLWVAREILAINGMTIRETGTEGEGARFEIGIPADRIRMT